MGLAELIKKKNTVMGILNVTPDSFSDGGKYLDPDSAFSHACQMQQQGADIIDVGGQSNRPGSMQVSEDEELSRVIPVIGTIKKKLDIPISCDTSRPAVAEAALKSGASMINDVNGFRNPLMREIASAYKASICIMHMQGSPQDMQQAPSYKDVLLEIRNFLHDQAKLCEEAAISADDIIIDPGIGFGKTLEHNLEIMANIGYFNIRYPVLIGLSRKSFIAKILDLSVEKRLIPTLAAEIYCVLNGVSMLRVHDVKETIESLEVLTAIRKHKNG